MFTKIATVVAAAAGGLLEHFARKRASPRLVLAELFLRATHRKKPADPAQLRRQYAGRPYPDLPPIPKPLRASCNIEERLVSDHRVVTFRPTECAAKWHIVYTHGGAYTNQLVTPHWLIVKALIDATGATVTVPIYPLAPEHTYRDAYRFLEAVYCDVLEDTAPENVVLCGDSAGGGLAVGQALAFREARLAMPGRIILFSPWLDVTVANQDAVAHADRDFMLDVDSLRERGLWWAGETDPRDPLISPMFGDLSGLPPMMIFQGTEDLLLPDARKFARAVHEAGGDAELFETKGAFHVFMGATFTPEARRVYETIGHALGARD